MRGWRNEFFASGATGRTRGLDEPFGAHDVAGFECESHQQLGGLAGGDAAAHAIALWVSDGNLARRVYERAGFNAPVLREDQRRFSSSVQDVLNLQRAIEASQRPLVNCGVALHSLRAARAESVLRMVYVLFTEGYFASSGERVLRLELCEEAIRLAMLVAAHPRFIPEIARRLADPAFTKRLHLTEYHLEQFVQKREQLLQEVLDGLDKESMAALALIYMKKDHLESPVSLQESEEDALRRLGSSLGQCIAALESVPSRISCLAHSAAAAGSVFASEIRFGHGEEYSRPNAPATCGDAKEVPV